MTGITVKIEGMKCQHCVMNVKKALDSLAGVRSASVSRGGVNVDVNDPAVCEDIIVKATQDAG